MDDLIIREATPANAEYIALLGRITFTETFGHYFKNPNDLSVYIEKTFSVKKIRSSIQKLNNVFWIAFVDELPVGYAKLKIHSPSEFVSSEQTAQLQKIYVLKDFLAKKIGFKLQDVLLVKAVAAGSQAIWLSVLDSNERAINFYSKNGFAPVGDHDFQIGQEHFEFVVMVKKINLL
jgi:ribosomal protein S18 acetylase RimI-like enzyme